MNSIIMDVSYQFGELPSTSLSSIFVCSIFIIPLPTFSRYLSTSTYSTPQGLLRITSFFPGFHPGLLFFAPFQGAGNNNLTSLEFLSGLVHCSQLRDSSFAPATRDAVDILLLDIHYSSTHF